MRPITRSPLLHTVLLAVFPFALSCGGQADGSSSSGSSEATASADRPVPAPTASPAGAMPALATSDGPNHVVVYKSPTCGCCSSWVEHLQTEGFEVEAHDRADLDRVKDLMGVPGRLRSCHTALVDGYLVEGHVPASTIRRLLEERPEVAGLAVPGMPVGSPGMEVPGREADPYDVLAFEGSGEVEVYERH